MNVGIVLLVTLALLIALGLPIAFSIGISSIVALIMMGKALMVFPQFLVAGTDKFALLAIPFFILVGAIMEKSRISDALIELASKLVGFIVGGLAMVTVVASMFFAAVSGSGPATVAAIGSIMIPEMKRRGYSIDFAAGIAASAGALGPIIPPSIPMIVFGVIAQVSITKLFLTGVGAGLLLGGLLIITSFIKAKRENVPKFGRVPSGIEVLRALWNAKFALGAPLIILGGIYGGVFTPSEAGAIGCIYCMIVGFCITKELTLGKLMECLISTAKLSAIIMFIIANAAIFGWIMASARVPVAVSQFMLNLCQGSRVLFLILVNVLLLLVGAVMDTVAAQIILVPVLLPAAMKLGIDPIHFGCIVVVNLVIGYMTPPLGYNLYVAAPLSGLNLERTSKAVVPFLIASIIGLFLLSYIPSIPLFFPKLLMR
ncbi:MAG: TRAP transporter large permease [Synergistetes bacterium]|nr:TRAP transporter large permease [Synergistota bacterium]